MADAVSRMREIWFKMIEHQETAEERAEFDALRHIVEKWSKKITAYTKKVNGIKGIDAAPAS